MWAKKSYHKVNAQAAEKQCENSKYFWTGISLEEDPKWNSTKASFAESPLQTLQQIVSHPVF